jgi:hypothetical protein
MVLGLFPQSVSEDAMNITLSNGRVFRVETEDELIAFCLWGARADGGVMTRLAVLCACAGVVLAVACMLETDVAASLVKAMSAVMFGLVGIGLLILERE